MLSGNRVELLTEPYAILFALAQDIREASASCYLEFYIWQAGGWADQVAEFLDCGEESPENLLRHLGAMRGGDGRPGPFLRCLTELDAMPPDLAGAFRHLDLGPVEMEAASIRRTLDVLYRRRPQPSGFRRAEKGCRQPPVGHGARKWLELNAQLVKEQVRGRFLANVRLASEAAAQLTRERAEFKERYNGGGGTWNTSSGRPCASGPSATWFPATRAWCVR